MKRFLGICTARNYLCDYYEFSDKVKIKEIADKNMVLRVLEAP